MRPRTRSGWGLASILRARPMPLVLPRRALLLTGIALAVTAFGASTASAAAQEHGFSASAYGTQVRVGNVVTSGRSAAVSLGCTSAIGVTHSNTAASVNVPSVLSTGTIDTRAASKTTTTGVGSTAMSKTQSANLLGGLVTATMIRSYTTTSYNTSTDRFHNSAAGTTFVGLVVGGHAITGTPPPNTKITLPGVGYVVLNQQSSHIGTSSASMTVIGIHLVVTATTPLAPSGTQVWVSFANSSLTGPVTGLLNGLSFGTSANLGTTLIAGESFPEYMSCLGTGGATKSNTGAGVTIPGVLTSGTIDDTATGTVSSTEDSGEMTSTVQGLNLLSGTVTATAIKADVTATGNPPTLGDNSSFLGLQVAGHPEITDNVPPNTKLSLPGIGTLWLHRRIETPTGIKVIMIQLIIGSSGTGLPVGAVVDVGYARVGVG